MQRIALIAKAYLVGFYVSCGFSVTRLSPVVHGQDSWFELVVDCAAARRLPIVQVRHRVVIANNSERLTQHD